MPRGVPASGKRRTSAVVSAEQAAETSLAGGSVDDPFGFESSFVDEVAQADLPAEELIEVPVSEVEVEPELLTPEQEEIKRLRDLLAVKQGREDVLPEVDAVSADADGERILIHFLEDGLTVLGHVKYRGDELEFVVGSRAYKDTFNRRGETWLDLRNDEFAQVDRFGKIMFRNGPWPGKTYLDGGFEPLRGDREGSRVAPPTEAELLAAEKARKRRAAPHLPAQV